MSHQSIVRCRALRVMRYSVGLAILWHLMNIRGLIKATVYPQWPLENNDHAFF